MTHRFPKESPRKECAVPICGRLTRPGSVSVYCARHAHRLDSYGDPRGAPADDRKMRLHVAFARKALEHVRGRPALDAALSIAHDLLTKWRAERGFTFELIVQASFRALHDNGVKPDDLLERVASAIEYVRDSGRDFPSVDAERVAVARAVLRLIPTTARPGGNKGKYLRFLGEVLLSQLGRAAIAMCRKYRDELEAQRERIEASTRFDIEETTGDTHR